MEGIFNEHSLQQFNLVIKMASLCREDFVKFVKDTPVVVWYYDFYITLAEYTFWAYWQTLIITTELCDT